MVHAATVSGVVLLLSAYPNCEVLRDSSTNTNLITKKGENKKKRDVRDHFVKVQAAEDDFRLRVTQFRSEVEDSVERATTAFSKRQANEETTLTLSGKKTDNVNTSEVFSSAHVLQLLI